MSYAAAAAAATAAVGGAYCAYRLYRRRCEEPLPARWTRVGTLADISVYPIKSCNPVALDKAECTILGLKDGWLRDRVLMVVDEKNNFITARVYRELFLVYPSLQGSVLRLGVKDDAMEPIHVDLAEVVLQEPCTATCWGSAVPVHDCGRAAGEWFSRLLARGSAGFRLVLYAAEHGRFYRGTKYFKFGKNDTGAFPDEASFNIINQASVDELNTRLENCRVTARTYRPNFVVAGPAPYAEDSWRYIKIGDNVFKIIKPCTRCVITTMDPETGVRNSAGMDALKSYRQIEDPAVRLSEGNSPRMGLQMALRSAPGGLVALDDPVYVA